MPNTMTNILETNREKCIFDSFVYPAKNMFMFGKFYVIYYYIYDHLLFKCWLFLPTIFDRTSQIYLNDNLRDDSQGHQL